MTKEYIDSLLQMDKNSAMDINAHDLKNRFLFPFFPTTIVDNFYEDPDLWREFALEQEFYKGNRGSWPGLRTALLHESHPDVLEIVSNKLKLVLKEYGYTEFLELQVSFQLIDETYGRGWVHDDDPKLQIAGVVYLNKNTGPGCGTTVYKDAPDFNGEEFSKMFMKDVLLASPEERLEFAKYREDQVSHFTPLVQVESVYNRMVMFDCRNWHSADQFFGTTKEESRLNQIFFIRIK